MSEDKEIQYRLSAVDAAQHNEERPTPAATVGQIVPFIVKHVHEDDSLDGCAIIGTVDDPLLFHCERITKGSGNGQWQTPTV